MADATQKHKVLVIDDSFMVRKSLVDQLSGDRFEVFEAKDGPSGLTEAVRLNPDVILLDFVMPGMNGHEVYQALRKQPQFTNTPVILISSSREEVIKKFGQPFIGFDFLPKQFTRAQLEERIDAILPMVPTQVDNALAAERESPFKLVLTRLEQLEARFTHEMGRLVEPVERLEERIQGLESLPERAVLIETRLQSLAPVSPLDLSFLEVRLDMLAASLSQNSPTAQIMERLDALETRLNPLRNPDPAILHQLQTIEQNLSRPLPPDRSEEVIGRLQVLEQGLNRPVAPDHTFEILDQLRMLEGKLVQLSNTPTPWAGVMERLEAISWAVSNREAAPPADLEPVLNRLNDLEDKVLAPTQTPSTAASPSFLAWGSLILTLFNAALLVFLLNRP